MSSTLSSRSESSSSRNWWPRKDKPSSRDSKQSNGILSAIGFKAKKHPTSLAIQDPPPLLPPPLISSPPPPKPTQYANRPPSKSVSSTRSRVDSIEPRTPVDAQRDTAVTRHSLLTLSDVDPFAARTIALPHSPIDPNRLSAYSSGSSGPEYLPKGILNNNRGSMASSSSNSNSQYHGDSSPSLDYSSHRLLSPKKSTGSLYRQTSVTSSQNEMVQAWESLSHNNSQSFMKSSATLTDKNRLSQPEGAPQPRPPMRARGLTESGSTPHPPFLRDDRPFPASSSEVTSPRVVVRQPSVTRVGLPLSAPPSQQLPLPPTSGSARTNLDGIEFSGSSVSSSSLSFASSRDTAMVNQHYTTRQNNPKPLDTSMFTKPFEMDSSSESKVLHPPRTLKKALSHQSLTKRAPPPTTSVPSTPLYEAPPLEKAPKKQRSFHHPRIPMPSSRTFISSTPVGSPPFEELTMVEPRRELSNGPSTPGRKRLFSGSSIRSRPSTSQSPNTDYEDDARSVFSLPIEHSQASTFTNWDGSSPQMTIRRSQPQADYVPQQILSPEDLAKIEAELQEERLHGKTRVRGMSIMSSATMASAEWEISDAAAAHRDMLSSGPSRTASLGAGGIIKHAGRPRPSTSQGPGTISLTPPPRPWAQRRSSPSTPNENTGMIALSPPPRKNVRKKVAIEAPPQNPKPPPSSMATTKRRKSLMRKPSFLDIGNDDDDEDEDEDTDGEGEYDKDEPPPPPPPAQQLSQTLSITTKKMTKDSSFLDLARESFDTVRSD